MLFPVNFSFNTGDYFSQIHCDDSFAADHFVKSAFNCALCLALGFFIAHLFVDHKLLLHYYSVNDVSYFSDNMLSLEVHDVDYSYLVKVHIII